MFVLFAFRGLVLGNCMVSGADRGAVLLAIGARNFSLVILSLSVLLGIII